MAFLNETGLARYDGKLKNLLANTYSTSAAYDVGDYCIHGGSLYRCTTAIPSAEAWTSGHWTKVRLGDELDAVAEAVENLKLDMADAYNATDAHAVGDYVIRNNVLYRCTTAIGSGGETWNAAHWMAVNIGDELVSIKAEIGILKEDLADEYDSTATYSVGDYCLRNGVLYRCTTAITTAEAWTSGHWSIVQVGDELSALKGAINARVYNLTDFIIARLSYDRLQIKGYNGVEQYLIEFNPIEQKIAQVHTLNGVDFVTDWSFSNLAKPLTPTIVSQSNYTFDNGGALTVLQYDKLVQVNGGFRCETEVGTSPGQLIATGLPHPKTITFVSFPERNGNRKSARVFVDEYGNLYFRFGTPSGSYDCSFTYISE